MPWPFSRKRDEMDVESLLARADAASEVARPEVAGAPSSAADSGASFRLPIEDVFMITGRGVVVTGTVEAGRVEVGDQVEVSRDGTVLHTVRVTGIEAFRKLLDSAETGSNVGLLLKGVSKGDLARGDVITGR